MPALRTSRLLPLTEVPIGASVLGVEVVRHAAGNRGPIAGVLLGGQYVFERDAWSGGTTIVNRSPAMLS